MIHTVTQLFETNKFILMEMFLLFFKSSMTTGLTSVTHVNVIDSRIICLQLLVLKEYIIIIEPILTKFILFYPFLSLILNKNWSSFLFFFLHFSVTYHHVFGDLAWKI